MINNSVTDWRGKVIGFRCFTCGGIFSSMWGNTCNNCRDRQEANNNMLDEIAKLRVAVEELSKK